MGLEMVVPTNLAEAIALCEAIRTSNRVYREQIMEVIFEYPEFVVCPLSLTEERGTPNAKEQVQFL